MSSPVTLRTWLCHLLVSGGPPYGTAIKLYDHLDWITNGRVLRAVWGCWVDVDGQPARGACTGHPWELSKSWRTLLARRPVTGAVSPSAHEERDAFAPAHSHDPRDGVEGVPAELVADLSSDHVGVRAGAGTPRLDSFVVRRDGTGTPYPVWRNTWRRLAS